MTATMTSHRYKWESVNDEEFERLEKTRRQEEDDVYFKIPQKPQNMMKDWTEWRTLVTDAMIDVIQTEHDSRPEVAVLTSSEASKTPFFFKDDMFIHGKRAKDRYGGEPITEEDDTKTKLQKKIMDSNFYLFGIPRVSIKKGITTPEQGSSSLSRRHSMLDHAKTRAPDVDINRAKHRRHSMPLNTYNVSTNIDRNERPKLSRQMSGGHDRLLNPIDEINENADTNYYHRRHSSALLNPTLPPR